MRKSSGRNSLPARPNITVFFTKQISIIPTTGSPWSFNVFETGSVSYVSSKGKSAVVAYLKWLSLHSLPARLCCTSSSIVGI